jgi:hypothetical protein
MFLGIGVGPEFETEPANRSIAECDHRPELPRCVNMQQRKRRFGGIKGFASQMQQHRGILANRIEQDWAGGLRGDFAENLDAFGFQGRQV